MSGLLRKDDAVKVCLDFLRDYSDVDLNEIKELVEQEMQQKVQISRYRKIEPLERLNNLVFDISPGVITKHIQVDQLRRWCKNMQVEMQMAIVELPLKE